MKIITPIPALCSFLAFAATAPAADLHVPSDHSTIQTAVDAAQAGDTIHIAAGVYVEQINITGKNLTLIGQPGTILRAFPGMEQAIPGDITSRCLLFIHLSQDVTSRGLSFEGDQLADQQGDNLNGVYYLDSGGTVEDCRFTGFREREAGAMASRAIRCQNDLPGAPLYSFRVTGNTIVDSYTGMRILGAPDTLSLDVTIENNVVRGVGPSSNSSGELRGVYLGQGVTGSVIGNTISGFSYTGTNAEFPWAWGIIGIGGGFPNNRPLDPIRFEDNTLEDNNLHMVLSKADECKVIDNRFEGTGPGLSEAGVWFSGRDVEVRGNTFRDMPTGVIVGGEDPILGTDLGLAVDAVLTDNRFADVETPVDHQPQSSATEEGTVLSPFPPPSLEIELAMKISWPDFYRDWSLETSIDAEIWMPLDRPLLLSEEGHYQVTVPTDEDKKFFRLIKGSTP